MAETISAIVPLYNGAPYIEEALRSILAQERPADEIIVVDDGSTDGGADIVREQALANPKIRLLTKTNGGQGSARNFGIRASTGSLIALLDQDDVWYDDHLGKLEQPFLEQQNRPLGWVYSDLDQINARGWMICHNFISTLPPNEHPKHTLQCCLRQDMFVLPGASLIAREALLEVGGFDEDLSGYEDDDLFLRMFCAGYRSIFITEALTKWRIHDSSTSFSWRMARSRALYFENLIKMFPDEPALGRAYIRNLVAPRFAWNFTADIVKSIGARDREAMAAAAQRLTRTASFLPWRLRAPIAIALLLLKIPPLAALVPACAATMGFVFNGRMKKNHDTPAAAGHQVTSVRDTR